MFSVSAVIIERFNFPTGGLFLSYLALLKIQKVKFNCCSVYVEWYCSIWSPIVPNKASQKSRFDSV